MPHIARLYVDHNLTPGTRITLGEMQSRYLAATLRAREGQIVRLFNGRDGEWSTAIARIGKRQVELEVRERVAAFVPTPDLWLCFAPVKNEKIDTIARRATELGIRRLQPVMTQRTAVSRVNTERLRANAIEAAEQCGRHDVPEVMDPVKLEALLAGWNAARLLIHCDESGGGAPVSALLPALPKGPVAVLIGPEGGFSEPERGILAQAPYIMALSLGPRILRAETAALAALANVQAWLGDWNGNMR